MILAGNVCIILSIFLNTAMHICET